MALLHSEADGTYTAALPKSDGGTAIVALRLPPLLRRMAVNTAVADAYRADDTYAWQAASMAALALGWMGPDLEIGKPSTDILTLGEAAADAFHAQGFDVFHADFITAGSELLGHVIDSLRSMTRDEEQATEDAAEVFQDAAEGTQP